MLSQEHRKEQWPQISTRDFQTGHQEKLLLMSSIALELVSRVAVKSLSQPVFKTWLDKVTAKTVIF